MRSGCERPADGGRSETRKVDEHAGKFGEDPPIRPSVGDEEQECVRRVIPALQLGSPDERLDIAEARLELDGCSHPASIQHRVPSPDVDPFVPSRQRNLDAIAQWWTNEFKKRSEAEKLTGIANRWSSGIQPNRWGKAEDRRDAIEFEDRQLCDAATLDLAVVDPRHLAGVGDVFLAVAEDKATLAELLADLIHVPVGEACPAVEGSSRRRHKPIVIRGPLPGLIRWFRGYNAGVSRAGRGLSFRSSPRNPGHLHAEGLPTLVQRPHTQARWQQ